MPTPVAIGAMISQLAGAIEAELPVLATIPAVKPPIIQQITQALESLKQAASAFATSDAPGDVAQRVATDINAVLATLATVAPLLPPQFQLAFRVAQFVLPALEAAVQMLVTKTPAAA